MTDATLNDHARDLELAVARIAGHAEEVAKHIADGNIDSASLVLGVKENDRDALNDSWTELRAKLEAAGADWRRASDA